jgi:hypothetical protein
MPQPFIATLLPQGVYKLDGIIFKKHETED